MKLPPEPCVTAASEDKNNRSRHERRSLRWVAADAETLCCAHVRSVVEITRETTVLRVTRPPVPSCLVTTNVPSGEASITG